MGEASGLTEAAQHVETGSKGVSFEASITAIGKRGGGQNVLSEKGSSADCAAYLNPPHTPFPQQFLRERVLFCRPLYPSSAALCEAGEGSAHICFILGSVYLLPTRSERDRVRLEDYVHI